LGFDGEGRGSKKEKKERHDEIYSGSHHEKCLLGEALLGLEEKESG